MNKRVLALDYDGTVFVNDEVSDRTLNALKQWKEKGNLLVLVTGRDWNLVLEALSRNDLPFDYYICANGSVGYDSKGNELFSNTLSHALTMNIITDTIMKDSLYFIIADRNGRYLLDNYSELLDLNKFYYTEVINTQKLEDLGPVFQIDTVFDSHEKMLVVTKAMVEKYGEHVSIHPNVVTIDFGMVGGSKAKGIQNLLDRVEIDAQSVVCAGDGYNDLSMIETYGGYTMHWGVEPLKQRAIKCVGDVSEIVEDLL